MTLHVPLFGASCSEGIFFFSREKRVHKVSCDRLEGCVCRSEEDGSRL